jgi:hypothetical protein
MALVERDTSVYNKRKSISWYMNSNETSPCNWQIGKLIISMMCQWSKFATYGHYTCFSRVEPKIVCNYLFVELEVEVLLNMQEANC